MPEAVERDGVRLYYERDGAGDPPFVFIHGWCCDHTFFQPQSDHFKAAHTVVSLDLRGCGRSDQPAGGYDIPTMADDVAWLCRDLDLSRPVVVGHSMGSLIALELAARHPTIPGAIVALDPGPIHPTPEARRFYEGFAEHLDGPDGADVRRAFVESMVPGDLPDLARKIVETMTSTPLEVGVATMRGTVAWNGLAAFLLCDAPVLLLRAQVGGSNDPGRLLALKPNMHVGVTVGAGHFLQFEVADQVNAMIERFFVVALER